MYLLIYQFREKNKYVLEHYSTTKRLLMPFWQLNFNDLSSSSILKFHVKLHSCI